MPLHIALGPALAGVGEHIREQALLHARQGERALLLLPSSRDVSRATGQIARSVTLGVQARTFDDHLDALWDVLGDGRSLTTPVQRLVMLEESVRHCKPHSRGLELDSKGVIRTLATVVQRVGEVEWESPRPGVTPGVGGDLLECAVIYDTLLAKAGLIERSAAHRIVCDRIGQIEPPPFIAIEGFSSLTRAQERFVLEFATRTLVSIGLVYDESIPASRASGALVQRLSEAGEVHSVEVSREDVPEEIARVGAPAPGPDAVPTRPRGAIVLSESWGPAAEAARVVREVQDALEAGWAPGEVAVVFRNAAPHVRRLRTAFDESGIKAEFDAGVPFRSTGLGRALLLLLGLRGAEGAYEKLIDVLRSPYGPTPHHILDDLDARVRGTRRDGLQQVESWLRHQHPPSAAFIAQVRQASASIGDPKAEQRWYRLTNEMLQRAHGDQDRSAFDLVTDAAAARGFISAVVSMSGLGVKGSGPATLVSALGEAQVMLSSAERADHVQVMGAERARGRSFECVIIGGLTSGEFPRTVGQDALSAPGVAAVFEAAGIDLSPRSDVAAERQLFYLAATRARRRLVLSWQSHDSEGRPVRPSLFLDEVLDQYRVGSGDELPQELPHHVLRLDAQDEHEQAPRSERRSQRSRAAGARDPHEQDPAISDARRRAAGVRSSDSAAVRRANAAREVFSASEIETYLQCPYRWYVDRMVRPRELDERFDRSAAGRLAHEIMRRFYDEFTQRSGLPRVTPDTLELAGEVHAHVANAALLECGASGAAEVAATRAVVRQTLRLVEADAHLLSGFAPALREWSFGAGEDPPEDLGGFSLAGRIDRIDLTDTDLIVMDYKLGRDADGRAAAKFDQEGIVQAPLYAEVAGRRLQRRVAGAVYRPVGGGRPRGFFADTLNGDGFVRTDRRSADEIAALIEDAIVRARAAVDGIRAGEIPARPRGTACPAFCSARGFCEEWRQGRA